MGIGVSKVAAVSLQVSDLDRSVRWYCDVLDLRLVREFVVTEELWGVVLLDTDAEYALVLQPLPPGASAANLRGSRPVVLAVDSRGCVEDIAGRLRRLGLRPKGPLTDPDGVLVDVADPDGILLRFRYVTAPASTAFRGVTYDAAGTITGTYEHARLSTPERLVPDRTPPVSDRPPEASAAEQPHAGGELPQASQGDRGRFGG
ncbi:VOC family protein [Streptomyces sp. NPDC006879]|uniref:VOC family protein n=1 Tax=Streptomyces sp. NPDC006879 TaxID=3364767 RepID=UPI0036B9BC3F